MQLTPPPPSRQLGGFCRAAWIMTMIVNLSRFTCAVAPFRQDETLNQQHLHSRRPTAVHRRHRMMQPPLGHTLRRKLESIVYNDSNYIEVSESGVSNDDDTATRYVTIGDMVLRAPPPHANASSALARPVDFSGNRRLQQTTDDSESLSEPRRLFWEAFGKRDAFKAQSPVYSSDNVLERFHYIVLPVWWSNADSSNPSLRMDLGSIQRTMGRVRDYYLEMSWDLHSMSFEVLDQVVLTGVPSTNARFGNSEDAARAILDSRGLVEFQDYDGIMLVYHLADQHEFSGAGGWGGVNDNFLWMSYPLSLDVTRHEMGHNYGHPHHISNRYYWRFARTHVEDHYDGWDMMSGGNGFVKSDLAAASKWFYGWIPDNAVVTMQPEGATTHCPTCLSEINSLQLWTFESDDILPSSSRPMGVHIPLFAASNAPDEIYSYWLSYRGTNNDGLASGGLSIHLSWFTLGGIFGASYDSLNFDAFGGTNSTTHDSFVVPETCYVIAPPALLRDLGYAAAEEIRPVVCVDSVSVGRFITISAFFLQENPAPGGVVNVQNRGSIGCTSGGGIIREDLLADLGWSAHLYHFTGSGVAGELEVSLCSETGRTFSQATAYFYDTPPFSYLSFDSPPGYGAFHKVESSSICATGSQSLTYVADYGETWVLVVGDDNDAVAGAATRLVATCQLSKCLVNEYLEGGRCIQCPDNFRSDEGSTSVSDCKPCPSGLLLEHPRAKTCTSPHGDLEFSPVDGANGWRVWTPSAATKRGWLWDIAELTFYTTPNCAAGSEVDPSLGTAIDSGNAGNGWNPENAFGGGGSWGGRPDAADSFWIGKMFPSNVSVKCLRLDQPDTNGATELQVQTFDTSSETWVNTWIAKGLGFGPMDIPLWTSNGWRLWTPSSKTKEGWLWDVEELSFFESLDCSGSPISTTPVSRGGPNTAIDSGNAGSGWEPDNAFLPPGPRWGGRPQDDVFWLGMMFAESQTVGCLRLHQIGNIGALEAHVQALVPATGEWITTTVARKLEGDFHTISLQRAQEKTCLDDPDAFFKRRKRTCAWLAAWKKNTKRKKKFCGKTIGGVLVSEACCKTCSSFK